MLGIIMTAFILNVPELHSHNMILSCMYISTSSRNCRSLASPPLLSALASPAVDRLLQDFYNHKASKFHRIQTLCNSTQSLRVSTPLRDSESQERLHSCRAHTKQCAHQDPGEGAVTPYENDQTYLLVLECLLQRQGVAVAVAHREDDDTGSRSSGKYSLA